jgi:hypothetical protein
MYKKTFQNNTKGENWKKVCLGKERKYVKLMQERLVSQRHIWPVQRVVVCISSTI